MERILKVKSQEGKVLSDNFFRTKNISQSSAVRINQSKNILFDNFQPVSADSWFWIDGANSSEIIFKGKNAAELNPKPNFAKVLQKTHKSLYH